jgi:hypothetical protein
MKTFKWNPDKNDWLKANRQLCFEDIVFNIEQGNISDIIENPNQKQYKGQKIYLIEINKYVYMVPYFEDVEGNYLIIIIPRRKMAKKYAGVKNE